MPDFFSKEWHKWREQAQRRLKDGEQGGQRSRCCSRVGGLAKIEAQLYDFQIPVAKLTPEKLINKVRRIIEAIICERLVYLGSTPVQTRDNPASLERVFFLHADLCWQQLKVNRNPSFFRPLHLHEDKSCGVPDFVGESAIAFRTGFAESDVGTR